MKGFLLTFVALPLTLAGLRGGELEKNPTFDLTTIYGETFHGCRIYKVTPATVDVVYDSGVAKIKFEVLDESWREHFHYDPEKARAYQERQVARDKVATAKLNELRKKQEAAQAKMLQLVASMQQKQAEADLQRQQAQTDTDVVTDDATPLPPLAPYPGDPSAPPPPAPAAGAQPPYGPLVPPLPPLGPVYTPGSTSPPPGVVNDPFAGSTYDPFAPYSGGYVIIGGYRYPRYRSGFGLHYSGGRYYSPYGYRR